MEVKDLDDFVCLITTQFNTIFEDSTISPLNFIFGRLLHCQVIKLDSQNHGLIKFFKMEDQNCANKTKILAAT